MKKSQVMKAEQEVEVPGPFLDGRVAAGEVIVALTVRSTQKRLAKKAEQEVEVPGPFLDGRVAAKKADRAVKVPVLILDDPFKEVVVVVTRPILLPCLLTMAARSSQVKRTSRENLPLDDGAIVELRFLRWI